VRGPKQFGQSGPIEPPVEVDDVAQAIMTNKILQGRRGWAITRYVKNYVQSVCN
jgi:hypothetical protein